MPSLRKKSTQTSQNSPWLTLKHFYLILLKLSDSMKIQNYFWNAVINRCLGYYANYHWIYLLQHCAKLVTLYWLSGEMCETHAPFSTPPYPFLVAALPAFDGDGRSCVVAALTQLSELFLHCCILRIPSGKLVITLAVPPILNQRLHDVTIWNVTLI